MQTRLLTTLACLSLLASTACGGAADVKGSTSAHLEATGVQMADPAADLSYSSVAHGNRRLGYELAAAIPTDDGNLVFSPASLSVAFAMLREGAVGPTGEEIDRVLHLPADRSAEYNGLLHELSDVGQGSTLELNDALFLDPSLTVKHGYLEALKKWYGAGVEQTGFPHPALEVINRWVDGKTHGRIPKLLDQLDPQAVFALVNTIYLNAKWQLPFEAANTSDSKFTTRDGTRVTARMMHAETTYDYAGSDKWQAIRLPYQGGKLSMVVLLPRDNTDPVDLLAADVLAAADRGFSERHVELSLPKWDLETSAELVDVLRRLGMRGTFGGQGDFSELTSDPSFAVSRVLQKANITVGEKGTEAAAATVIVGETAAAAPPPDLVEFRADHPFAFAIVHDSTGVPLFEGVVADPS